MFVNEVVMKVIHNLLADAQDCHSHIPYNEKKIKKGNVFDENTHLGLLRRIFFLFISTTHVKSSYILKANMNIYFSVFEFCSRKSLRVVSSHLQGVSVEAFDL